MVQFNSIKIKQEYSKSKIKATFNSIILSLILQINNLENNFFKMFKNKDKLDYKQLIHYLLLVVVELIKKEQKNRQKIQKKIKKKEKVVVIKIP